MSSIDGAERNVMYDVLPENVHNYYNHHAMCGNCGRSQSVMVRKGQALDGIGIMCRNCGLWISFRSHGKLWSG